MTSTPIRVSLGGELFFGSSSQAMEREARKLRVTIAGLSEVSLTCPGKLYQA